MCESIFSLECFSSVATSRISGKRFRNKFNASINDWPKNFICLFVLIMNNSIKLNLNAVSRKLERKRKAHTHTHTHTHKCFDMIYLKLMSKRFKNAFYFSINYYSLYWTLILLINSIHQSNIYLLDKSYICNEAPRIIQLLKQQIKFENFDNWKYVIGTITDILLFASDWRKQPFRAGLEKVFLNFMQNASKIHVKESAFL